MAAVKFPCPSCGQKLSANAPDLQKRVRCQRCDHRFRPVDVLDKDEPLPVVPEDGEAAVPRKRKKRRPKPKPKRQQTLLYGVSAPAAAPSTASEPAPEPASKPAPEPASESVSEPAPEPAPEPVPVVEPGPRTATSSVAATVIMRDEAELSSEPGPEPAPASEPAPEPASESAGASDQVTLISPNRKPLRPLLERLQADAPRPPPRRRNTTTLLELGDVAERLVAETHKRMRIRLVVAGIATVFPLLVLATALIRSSWRWLPGSVAAACVLVLLGWGGLRLLPRLATKLGPRVLPGRAAWWLTGGAGALAGAAGLITWGASAATVPLVAAGLPDAPDPGMEVNAAPPATVDAAVEPPDHVKVGSGVLYIPASFRTDDGSFDLVMHFHGNTKLVEQSIEQVGLNAIVHISNLGVESDPYEQYFAVPAVFEKLLKKIEQRAVKLGVERATVRRVAVTSWSAGYGAVYRILQSEADTERIDALMMLDGLHLGYVDEKNRTVDERHLAPFVRFAAAAAGKKKLFIITHSEIKTHGYASAGDTAQILFAQLGGTRTPLDPAKDSPARADFDEARRAVPRKFDQWLKAKSAGQIGDFYVWGYSGQSPEDHMAHLVQMSTTVLPKLVERWK